MKIWRLIITHYLEVQGRPGTNATWDENNKWYKKILIDQ